MYEFSKQPLGIGQQLDQAIKLTRHVYKSALTVVGLMIAIGVLSTFSGLNVAAETMDVESMGVSFWAGMIIFILLNVYLYFLLIVQVSFKAFDRGDLTDAMQVTLKKLLPMLWLFFLLMIAIMGGMILLVIPGLILTISLSMSLYCMALEGTGPLESLKRSHSLVWGNWTRTAMVFTVGGLLMIVFYLVVGVGVGALVLTSDQDSAQFWTNLLSSVITPFAQPFFIALGLIVFNDVRLRKEGGDLEAQIESL